jgi:hypothetical protein
MFENVLNNVVQITGGLLVLLAIPYIAIRIMEDSGLMDGMNINSYPWLC